METTLKVEPIFYLQNQIMENRQMKNTKDKKQKNIKKKQYEKPAIVHTTKIETLAGTCVNTVGQACVPAFD